MMKPQTMFYVNLVITCITCAVLLFSCGGCTNDQLAKMQSTVQVAQAAGASAAPVLQNQPWYVLSMVGLDILSSIAAALLVYKKSGTTQTVSN